IAALVARRAVAPVRPRAAGRRIADAVARRRRERADRLARLQPGLLRPPRLGVRVATVTVRVFAGLRERAGWPQREVEAVTVADVWATLGLGDEPEGLLYAVNHEYAPPERELADGDEVALIPPVSGGAYRLSEGPIDPNDVIREVLDPRAGGIATFIGTTRIQSRGRTVQHLD